MKNDDDKMREVEDATKYGEFVSSYFAWLTLDGQKERARDMSKMTQSQENDGK